MDLDFEIIDPDDANAHRASFTVDGQFNSPDAWIIPTTWVDGTGIKITHRLRPTKSTGYLGMSRETGRSRLITLKFEILCKDARRTKPVDLHFLELPFAGRECDYQSLTGKG